MHRDSPVLVAATRAYLPLLRASLRRPWVVIAAALVSLGVAGEILATRGSEFLPELNEGARDPDRGRQPPPRRPHDGRACRARLVPAALSHAMGDEMQRPMAVVIVGGTVSAAVLTRLVLPAMYRLTQPLFERLARKTVASPPSQTFAE